MPPFLIPALAFVRRLNLSQIALVVAIAFALMFRVQLGIERRHSEKQQTRINELVAELKRISTAKNDQAETTGRNIGKAVNHSRQADKVARVIEAAPLLGNCKTPAEIMGADL